VHRFHLPALVPKWCARCLVCPIVWLALAPGTRLGPAVWSARTLLVMHPFGGAPRGALLAAAGFRVAWPRAVMVDVALISIRQGTVGCIFHLVFWPSDLFTADSVAYCDVARGIAVTTCVFYLHSRTGECWACAEANWGLGVVMPLRCWLEAAPVVVYWRKAMWTHERRMLAA